MLSFVKGQPIAKVVSGPLSGEILYIYNIDDYPEDQKKTDAKLMKQFGLSVEDDKDIKQIIFNNLPKKELNKITKKEKEIILNSDSDSEDLEELKVAEKNKIEKIKDKIKNEIPEHLKREVYCIDCKFQPIVDPERHQSFAVFGPSGSGKSYYISKLLEDYRAKEKAHNLEPKDIFMFSRIGSDASFDEKKLKPFVRINTGRGSEDSFKKYPPEPSNFNNSIVIFDDITTISNRFVRATVQDLSNKILETGRHDDITGFWTNHVIRDKGNTKYIMNEATSLTFFPQSNLPAVLGYFKGCVGFNAQQLDRLKEISKKSRFISLLRTRPQCILYEQGAWLF